MKISPGCYYTVTFCYTCHITNGYIEINVISVVPNSPNCPPGAFPTNAQLLAAIKLYDLPMCDIPRCSDDNKSCVIIKVNIPLCKQWYYNQLPPLPFSAWEGLCQNPTRYCTTITGTCRNMKPPFQPPFKRCRGVVRSVTGSPVCPLPSEPKAPTYPQPVDGIAVPFGDCYHTLEDCPQPTPEEQQPE